MNMATVHLIAVKATVTATAAYAAVKVYALSTLLHSVPVAATMNAPLIGLNLFFLLCAWFLVKQQPGAATFAALGSILTALMV